MVTKRLFGVTKAGFEASAYTISNDRGIAVTVLDYGATLQSVVLPHRGERVDVVLGYDTIEEYENNDAYLGASIGRFAGRIPDAVLRIGERAFPVTPNEHGNHLHGGTVGFDKRMWNARCAEHSVEFELTSPDGDEGYPGTVRTLASYTLREDTLIVRYAGESDRETAWNPTNHAYWNLNGHAFGDARAHTLEIPADCYVPVGADMLPAAGETDVSGTRFDFRTAREIGGAYDHCFVLSGNPIRLFGNRGIGMEIRTDCKAVQFYTAEYLTARKGKGGARYSPFGAVCLETQGRQTQCNSSVAKESILKPSLCSGARKTEFRFLYQED